MLTDTKEGEIDSLLREGQEAAKRGDTEAARSFLSQVVERDPSNEQAWMWLSGVVDDVAEQQICLENVLVINPDNTKARQGLEYLNSQRNASEEATSVPPSPVSEYGASPADGTVAPHGDESHQEHPVSAEPTFGAPTWEDPGSPEEVFDISGLEMQTAPTLEGSLPWLQNLGQQPNDAGQYGTASVEAAMPEQPFDPSTMSNASPGSQPMGSERHETSFAGVTDEHPTAERQVDIAPFAPGQEELPMFDFSSFTEASGSGQPVNQGGADLSVDLGNPHFKFEDHVAAQAGAGGASASGFMELPAGGLNEMMNGPMGPMSEVNLPAPSELPGYKGEASDWAQPWYAENSDQPASNRVDEAVGVPLYSSGLGPEHLPRDPSGAKSGAVTMIKCPNCREEIADTTLACPKCRFSLFINCPNCHELVDASEAAPAKAEQCPHCHVPLDLMKLGQSGVDGAAQYQSTKLEQVGASSLLATSLDGDPRPRKRLSFGWVVDLVWLITIIAIVWALTQLPIWLHLTGQY